MDRLSAAADATETRLAEELDRIASAGVPERLVAAMRHALLGGGKRLRPFLVLESAALFDADRASALATGAALECVHGYSLVHDDLPAMDNDETRRGRPTVWKAFDDWTAILAGDALLTLAFEILAEAPMAITPEQRVNLAARLARASGGEGMVGGQVLDLLADKRGEPASPDFDHVRMLQSMKTGALILYAVEAGAIVGNAEPAELAALGDYGREIGFAFQIADDLLDHEGDAALVGKAVGKDAAAGKATLVDLLGVNAARSARDEALARAHAALEQFGGRAKTLRAAADFIGNRDH